VNRRQQLGASGAVGRRGDGARVSGRAWSAVAWLCAASITVLSQASGCAYSAQKQVTGWWMVETDNIQLRSPIRRSTAVWFAGEMQRSYDALARYALPCAANREHDRVKVTILSAFEFHRLAGAGAGGFYQRAGVTWFKDRDGELLLPDSLGVTARQTFQHELTHRLVFACFPSAPTWLNEGLAAFFETIQVDAGTVTLGRPPFAVSSAGISPRRTVIDGQPVWIMPVSSLPSVGTIVATRGGLIVHNQTTTLAAYAMAWGLVHFFELGAPDLSARFEAYLAAIQQPGRDPVVLFATTFENVPLQTRIIEYLRRGQFDHLQSAPSAIAARVVTPQVRELSEDDANLHLALLYAMVRTDHTRAQLAEHLALAKQNPRTRQTAYLVSAFALLRDKDFAGAERELQEILRSSPDNAAFLEAHLDVLLARKAPVPELQVAAERLRPVAATAGQFCSLAEAALRAGDRKAASELASRGLELDPRLVVCRSELAAPLAPPHQP